MTTLSEFQWFVCKVVMSWLVVQAVILGVHGWVPSATMMICRPTTIAKERVGTLSSPLHVGSNNDMMGDDDGEEECYDLCNDDSLPVYDVNEDDVVSAVPAVDGATARTRLEMQWAVWENEEACNVEELTTCGTSCNKCAGRGVVPCRFCGGTTILSMTNKDRHSMAVMCPVCSKTGVEACKACRGSGYIASWTSMMSK